MQNIEELKTCLPGAILQLDKQWIDVEYSHLTKLIFALKSKFSPENRIITTLLALFTKT